MLGSGNSHCLAVCIFWLQLEMQAVLWSLSATEKGVLLKYLSEVQQLFEAAFALERQPCTKPQHLGFGQGNMQGYRGTKCSPQLLVSA